jgi:hypothetical protein
VHATYEVGCPTRINGKEPAMTMLAAAMLKRRTAQV